MNLWAADHETRQREGVSPGVKWSHKTFSCPHFYSKTLALNLCARWSGCAMTDSQLTHSRFQNPKSLHRISLCGITNVLRHTEPTFNVFLKFHLNFMWSCGHLYPDAPSRRSVLWGCWQGPGSAWVKAPSSVRP